MEELIEVMGIKVNVWRGGRGEPFFLLTGFNGDFEIYSDFLGALAKRGFDVYGIEFPGSGKSEFPSAGWEFDHCVRLVEEIFVHYQISQALVLGHSWGAVTALRFVRFFPHRVKFLILMSSPILFKNKWPLIKKGKVPLWFFQAVFFLALAVLTIPARWFLKIHIVRLRHICSVMRRVDLVRLHVTNKGGVMRRIYSSAFATISTAEDAKKVKVPTLLLWGSKDFLTPPRNSRIFTKYLLRQEYIRPFAQ